MPGSLRLLAVLSAALTLNSCVTLKPSSQRPGNTATVIPAMPLRVWGDNTCGAGALATVLNHYGNAATEEDLIRSLKKGRNGGVVSVDLLLKARSEGFDSKLTRGDPGIIRSELEASRPVILMLKVVDLPGLNKDLYHYIVLDGLDEARGLMRMQFGDGKARWSPLASVEKPWQGTEYATLLIEPKSPARLQFDADLKKAVSMESAGRWDEAISLYNGLLAAHPDEADEAVVQVDLGNAQSAAGRTAEAESSFQKALSIDGQNRDALNNLAWLLFQQNRLPEAEQFARRAASIAGVDDDLVFDTLGEILTARGNCVEATDAFSTALRDVTAERLSSKAGLHLRLGKAQMACGRTAEAGESFRLALGENPDDATRKEIDAAVEALPR
ncbi:MAG: tetratricopeptide repeat protein [Acidobacteriota bacterium]